jgi:hypothetical protein
MGAGAWESGCPESRRGPLVREGLGPASPRQPSVHSSPSRCLGGLHEDDGGGHLLAPRALRARRRVSLSCSGSSERGGASPPLSACDLGPEPCAARLAVHRSEDVQDRGPKGLRTRLEKFEERSRNGRSGQATAPKLGQPSHFPLHLGARTCSPKLHPPDSQRFPCSCHRCPTDPRDEEVVIVRTPPLGQGAP